MVNFNDEYYLDQPFTEQHQQTERGPREGRSARRHRALRRNGGHRQTEMKRNARLQKKVLFVVTDGDDNASRESLEETVRRAAGREWSNGIRHRIAGRRESAPRASCPRNHCSAQPAELPSFPRRSKRLTRSAATVAHDIRNQYTIGYKPTTPKSVGGYRTIKVEARAKGYKKLFVRTRSGYYPGQEHPQP